MKKNYKALIKSIILFWITLLFSPIINGQIIFTSTPDSTAFVGEAYSYDVNVTAAPDAATFSLDSKPTGMTINASSGLISWTPSSVNQGGKIIVKAVNSYGSFYQTYYVYVSDAISCPANLFSYWKLDDEVGAAPDSAKDFINGYSAKNTTGTTISAVTGRVDQGLDLVRANKSQQYLTVADQNQYEYNRASDFSFSLWFKHSGAWDEDEVFIARGEGDYGARFVFGIDVSDDKTEGKLIFRLRDNKKLLAADSTEWAVMSTATITNDVWHQAVCVFDGLGRAGSDGIMRVYLDKVKTEWQYAYYPPEYDFSMTNKDLTIGWFDNFTPAIAFAFNGAMDEVGIWNKALSDADVTSLYNKGVAGTPYCSVGNYAPIIITTPGTSVNEDSPYSYTFRGRDYENSTLTKSAVVKPSWLSFNTSTGVLSGTPANANVGDTLVTLRISDGTVSVDQTFTISVVNVNDAPTISSTPVTAVNEDQPYSYTMVANDVDAGDAVTYSAPVLPGWLSFNTSTHVLSGTPTNDQVGTNPTQTYDVTLRATDKSNAQTNQSFTITVTNVNDDPVILSKESLSTNEDVNITLLLTNLTVNDVDNVYPDDFTLTVKEGTNYTFTGNTITPAEDYHGTITVNFDLSDGTATISDNIIISVVSINDAPVFTSTAKTTAKEGSLYTYVLNATDADLDALTYTATKLPTWLSFDTDSHVLAGTPQNENVGSDSVVIKVTDGTANVYQRFLLVVSQGVNSDPVITSEPPLTAAVGETYEYQMVASDEDGDELTFTAVAKPSWLVFQASTGFLTGIPAEADLGSHTVTLRVSDGIATDEQTFTVVVSLTGFEDHEAGNALVTNVYPVPVVSSATFELNLNSEGTIQILSLTGKILKQVNLTAGQSNVSIDMSDLDPALYIFRVTGDDNTEVGKITKR
jgi:VCBS repeat-containing protein